VRYELDMSDAIVIRPARAGDTEFVAGLASSLLEFGSPAWADTEAMAPGFREVLTKAVRCQGARSPVFIAEDADATPLGFISLRVRDDVTGTERGHVADLAVIEAARDRGVGRALMQAGEVWARELGLPALSLDVWSTNERALGFYRRLGYGTESVSLIKTLD
jgi:ribosomal protein S18 acetylase RimI-like enzyme